MGSRPLSPQQPAGLALLIASWSSDMSEFQPSKEATRLIFHSQTAESVTRVRQ